MRDIEDGPRTADLVSKRAMGRIQIGGEFSKLSAEEFDRIGRALRDSQGVEVRPRADR